VNKKTILGHETTFDEKVGQWNILDKTFEEGEAVYKESGTAADKTTEPRRKSGDATVPYHSLSWCNTWVNGNVKVTRAPQKPFYSADEVAVVDDVSILDYEELLPMGSRGHDTFIEEHNTGDISETTIWELDNVDHSKTLLDPGFLRQLAMTLKEDADKDEKLMTILEGALQDFTTSSENTMGARGATEKIPTTDTACTWNYKKAKCNYEVSPTSFLGRRGEREERNEWKKRAKRKDRTERKGGKCGGQENRKDGRT
jgi:hypothetical protein